MLRQTVKTQERTRLVEACYTRYREGFVTNVQQGKVPAQYQSVARDVAQYVVSPPIAVRRIDRYDGERVTYHYRSHRTERVEHETVAVDMFIGRMVPHTVPKGFKRIRYDGVQATKTFAKVKIPAASGGALEGRSLSCWGNLSPKPPNKDAIPPHRKQWGILASFREGGHSSSPGPGRGRGQGRGADHRPADLQTTL